MKRTEFLTEEVFTYTYTKHKKHVQALEFRFIEAVEHNQQQFVDWVLYDFISQEGFCLAESYISEKKETLSLRQLDYIEECIKEYFGVYEITKLKAKEAEVKDIFTGVKAKIDITDIYEDISLYSLLLGRISKKNNEIIGGNVIILPYHFKTILTGQIVEDFQLLKEKNQFLTYEEYFKKNTPKILAIVERLVSYKNVEGDVTVYQSSYAISDKVKLEALLKSNQDLKYDSEDKLYRFYCDKEIIAELLINNGKLEIECNSLEDRNMLKGLIEELAGDILHHLKDENLTLDDII